MDDDDADEDADDENADTYSASKIHAEVACSIRFKHGKDSV